MKKNLEDHISQWKSARSGNNVMRTTNIEKSKAGDGEYEIILKMSTKVMDIGRSETVSAKGKFKTTGQSLNEEGNDNPDVQLFDECASRLQKDFDKKTKATYQRLSGSGFSERNPY
jgi:hypothetical protein